LAYSSNNKGGNMSNIDVTQAINIREVDGEEVAIGEKRSLGVDSHWNHDNFVVLRIGDKTYSVNGRSLQVAIDNAMNTD